MAADHAGLFVLLQSGTRQVAADDTLNGQRLALPQQSMERPASF